MALRAHLHRLLGAWLSAWALACIAAPALALEPLVVVVSSEASPAFEQAAEALLAELARVGAAGAEVQRLNLEELQASSAAPRVFVALGSPAAAALARRDGRSLLLCALLPRSSFERIAQDSGRRVSNQFSALFLDQPLGRQLDLLRLGLPDARRVGVLWGPESQLQAAALGALAGARSLQLVGATVGGADGAFPGLKRVLEEADVLLALPDPLVFNSASIQNILLASYRARVPLVGFSQAYVRAGALLALFVTPEQVGQQAALLVRSALQGRSLPPEPVYSREFQVEVNQPVARSLGLRLDARALGDKLRQLEKVQ